MNDTSVIVVAIGAMILRPRIVGLQDQSRAIAQVHLSTVRLFTSINERRGLQPIVYQPPLRLHR